MRNRRRKEQKYWEHGKRAGKSSRSIRMTINRALDRPGRLTIPPDVRPPPLSPQARETKVQGLLERGMAIADKAALITLKAQLLAANTNLRRELIRARKMRKRLERSAYQLEQIAEVEGLTWLRRQLMETMDEARDAGDIAGALAAIRTLAVLAGHMQDQTDSPGGTTLNHYRLTPVGWVMCWSRY